MNYLEREGPRDECGVFAVYAPELEVSSLAFFALQALQHRGQEAAGIASSLDGKIMTVRDRGLVNHVFSENDIAALAGQAAIGHVRYSTTGSDTWANAQPIQRTDRRPLALAHNGNLINAVALHNDLTENGISFQSTSDSEIIAALISTSSADSAEEAVTEACLLIKGAFSTVILTEGKIIAFRDSARVRPLSLGRLTSGRYCVASETSAFDLIGADFVRDVSPGEIITLDEAGVHSTFFAPTSRSAFCLFEHIYFSRPDSVLEGRLVHLSRRRMGEILYRESPAEADIVIPVPDSGNPAAAGYSIASGIPRDDGLIKNRYVARTFIQPSQELRQVGLRMKFNPMADIVSGKRLVVVDDSIVRGNTTKQIVKILRSAGASEIHLRVSSPPILNPCHYGIDLSERSEMIAHQRSNDQIAEILGADSLAYLSLEGVYEAIAASSDGHCDACFSGNYPLEGDDDSKNAIINLPLANSSWPRS